MEWFFVDLKIAFMLFLWIIACVGCGWVVLSFAMRFFVAKQGSHLNLDSAILDSANQTKIAESNKNQSCEAPKSRPLRGAKNRFQASSSASADFLLEAEKRGTPPKSEKRQLLARRGSGVGGGAALLREKTSESNPKNDKNIADSANKMKNAESSAKNPSLRGARSEASATKQSKNNKMDCHEVATSATSRNDEMESKNSQNLAMAKTKTPDSAFFDDLALKVPFSLLCGMIFFTFLTSLIHLFFPINAFVSIVFLTFGIFAFWRKIRDFQLLNLKVLFSASVAFFAVVVLSFFHDSIGDSVNYHIQIVSYIQAENLIFGLGNIHGRLGFNGIIYNFYALTDVSQIFPALRSFIANEIVYFALIFSAIYILVTKNFAKFHLLFIVCSVIPFSFILKWAEFNALYCEGVGAVFGIFIFSALLYNLAQNSQNLPQISQNLSQNLPQNRFIALLFIISVFATMIKIANFALVLAVAITFIYLNRSFYRPKFYRAYFLLGIFCLIFCLPWAIKGIATSGMIAYPASVGFFKSLPFAVSEAQRESEVCWIMSWARAPGQNCVEVLQTSAWMVDWFSMKTRYFGYFKHFVYHFLASLALFLCLYFYNKMRKKCVESTPASSLRGTKCQSNLLDSAFGVAFVGVVVGILFWFYAGPDPRFGMVYIFPLVGLFMAYNISQIKIAESPRTKALFAILFIATLFPFWKLTRDMYMILIIFCLLFPSAILGAKIRRIYLVLLIILTFVSVPNMFRDRLGAIKQNPKVLPIFAKKQISDFGVEIYHRSDSAKDGYEAFTYEPRPMTPYSTHQIKETRFLGRKAYINAKKDER
ncbi:LIC_10190 family membrane protein [Helicobacter sp. 23-1045]